MANIGYGVTLSVSDAYPATTPTNAIGNVTDFTPPSPTREMIDVTSSSSPNMNREFMGGLVDNGEASFGINWDLGDANDILLRGISIERNPRKWRATFSQYSPARTVTFDGYLTSYDRGAPMADKMTATIKIKVTGQPVYA